MLALATNVVAASLLAFTIFFLCRHLHDVAKALDTAEHRYRWRCRRVPSDDWMGRCHRFGVAGSDLDVHGHLHVDATAFLGARAVYEVGL